MTISEAFVTCRTILMWITARSPRRTAGSKERDWLSCEDEWELMWRLRIERGVELMETARWLARVLVEGRKRRIMAPDLPEFVRRCIAWVRPRSACLESTEDQMTVLCTELVEDFDFQPSPMFLDPSGENKLTPDMLPAEAREVDLATVAPELASVIRRRLRDHPLTVIVADARYGERFRSVYASDASRQEAIRVVLASDASAMARLGRLDPVLVTRSARRLLPDLDLPLLLPRYPSISAESGREITEHLIRINLEAAETRQLKTA